MKRPLKSAHPESLLRMLAASVLVATTLGCLSTDPEPKTDVQPITQAEPTETVTTEAAAPAEVADPVAAVEEAPAPNLTAGLPPVPPDHFRVHYHRFDGNYDRVGLWTWDLRGEKDPAETDKEVLSTGSSPYGLYFDIDQSRFGNDNGPEERIGFVPRLRQDWNFKDGTDRTWRPDMGQEIFLIGNDPRLYTTAPDISPRIARAYLDGWERLVLVLSHPMAVADIVPENFAVSAEGKSIAVAQVTPASVNNGKADRLNVTLTNPVHSLAADYRVTAKGYKAQDITPRRVLDSAEFTSTEPMGAVYTPAETTFRLFSPLAKEMAIVLYDEATGTAGRREVPMARHENGTWSVSVPGDLEGKHYRVKVTTPIHGSVEIIDPYATNTTGDDGNPRITNLRSLDPEGFRPFNRPKYGDSPVDAIIYQIHLRDFTIHSSSGVPAEHAGKYLGITHANTTHPENSAITTGIAHLKELGVTHVQIQPFHDFDNKETAPTYNWGYMTAFFNTPEGTFSTDIRTTARVAEVKQMVKAFHDAGIGVILDVVYNHTGTQNTFELMAPGYFHRMRDDGSFWNGSGTGNEVRSEAPMARQFIIDSLKLWMEEYGIDGFRFDLMGLIDLETQASIRTELEALYPGVLIYGEPWAAAGPDGVGMGKVIYKDQMRGTGIAAFNDFFRDAIKGSPDGDDAGYIVNGSRRDAVKKGIAASLDDWCASPTETINYADVHDNLILWDKLQSSAPNATDDERKRMQMLSGAILAVSQGKMLLHTGVDFLRTKKMNHNSYNAGDDINAVDWNFKARNQDVAKYYVGLVALRKAHPLFRLRTAEEVRARLKFHDDKLPAAETILFTVNGEGLAGETWKSATVAINPTADPQTFTIPMEGTAMIYVLDDKAGNTVLGTANNTVTVPARSLAVLAQQ